MDKPSIREPVAARPPLLGRHLLGAVVGTDMGRLLAITVLVFLVMSALQPSLFPTIENLSSMAFQFPEFALLALGMMLTLLTGGIDLSIIGLANLSAIVAVLVMRRLAPDAQATGLDVVGAIAAGIVAALATAAVGGLINGIAIAGVGIPPILATLGTGQIYTGIAKVLTGGAALLGVPAMASVIGTGAIPFIGVPVPLVIFVVAAAGVAVLLNRTAFGMRIYLLGTNPLAARFAGIDNFSVTVRTYLLSSLLGACGGFIIAIRANSAKADYGTSYLLLTVLIGVLGGINPYGGFGKVSGLVLAVLSLQFLSSGLNMLQVSNFAVTMTWGGLLLLVMVINTARSSRSGGPPRKNLAKEHVHEEVDQQT